MNWRLVAVALLLVSSIARADNFVFVRNARNPVGSLSRAEVRKLFTGRSKQWSSGKVFQGVIGELDSAEFVWLSTVIFGMTPKDLLTKMKQEIFRGEMKRPIVVKSSEECIEVVQKTETALCVTTQASARSLPPEVETVMLTD
jgi:hypothetical protein